ncbi:ABC transporter substrate-binding protein [Pseudodesulfovibrio sp. zrk46]|uniref:ABC transporter substrate-binding protein n=1 Tax=Pseudodesulfovibrio sp. zrk46 TaxID=2725288 RepID=UPI001449924F|nr:ABC transporter substrate-binding protein [Pseudodesulfovibrio sp. zrk46]QJB56198.1 substrate-binding domain-containing protein [Pseudodesulfovibrio sp. zrk46]
MAYFAVSSAWASDRMSATFLNPGGKDDEFFSMMTSFMQAAADDLGVELEVVYCDRNHLKMRDEGLRLLNRPDPPEHLILINEKDAGGELLRLAADKGVHVALINEGLNGEYGDAFGGPGEILSNWILEYLPDDRQAGYLLGKALIQAARNRGSGLPSAGVSVVAISGNYRTGSSAQRVMGLRQAVEEEGRVHLLQVVPAYWEEAHAEKVVNGVMQRYPGTSVIWAASDVMARGAQTALARLPGGWGSKPVLGGIDWAKFALYEVKAGRFAATVGGHFMDGGWALVMLYDLYHGIALEQRRMQSKFSLITPDNVEEYLERFGTQDWSTIDFTRFSKKYNPGMKQYDFGLEAVLRQLRGE